jgi:hypothetical protein
MADDYVVFPATVLVDSSEQLPYGMRRINYDAYDDLDMIPDGYQDDLGPYSFDCLKGDASQQRLPLVIPVETANLLWGDYSIRGLESVLSVERKSLQDLFGTLGAGRERFKKELEALASYAVAAIVIEATWPDLYERPPSSSQLPPKSVQQSILAWMQEFPRIQWVLAGPRALAERLTFRILERCWRQRLAL